MFQRSTPVRLWREPIVSLGRR